ncbi:MAG: hypothetical protein WDZ32_00140 [Candidatus Saccharimonadales bacterium]
MGEFIPETPIYEVDGDNVESLNTDTIYELASVEHFYIHQCEEVELKAEYLAKDLNGMTRHHQGEKISFDREVALDDDSYAHLRKTTKEVGESTSADIFILKQFIVDYTDGRKTICAEVLAGDKEVVLVPLWNQERQTLIWPEFETETDPAPLRNSDLLA